MQAKPGRCLGSHWLGRPWLVLARLGLFLRWLFSFSNKFPISSNLRRQSFPRLDFLTYALFLHHPKSLVRLTSFTVLMCRFWNQIGPMLTSHPTGQTSHRVDRRMAGLGPLAGLFSVAFLPYLTAHSQRSPSRSQLEAETTR